MSTLFGVITVIAMIAVPTYLLWMLVRTVREARRKSGLQGIWRNFSLGIIVASLFLVSWTTHAMAEWRKYVQDQRTHGEPAHAGVGQPSKSRPLLRMHRAQNAVNDETVVTASLRIRHAAR